MKKLIGILVLSLLLSQSLIFSSRTFAQTAVECDYWGAMHGCDAYDCGRCVFLACGSDGGVLICGFEQ
jgi:hypothetical protein